MKYLPLILATAVFAFAGQGQVGSGGSLPRETTLTEGWRFQLDGESGPERADFDDSGWAAMAVPHNAQEISNELPASTRAVWYRRRLDLAPAPTGHRVLLDVLGTRRIQAWVNGVEAGRGAEFQHWLQVDITRLLRQGPNVLVLRTAVPGIQGFARLVTLAPLDFEPDGLRVDTPAWNGGPARVRIRTAVENTSDRARSFQATARVLGPEGKALVTVRSGNQRVAPRAKFDLELLSEQIANPPLWSPAEPRLSRVVVELHEEGQAPRSCEATFGFRWFGFDPDKGFSFNGQPFKLRGTVFYKIGPSRVANRQELWRYELGLLRGMGINIIRTAAGIDESILDEFDRAGILTLLDVNADADLGSVAENMRQDVRRRYNHPSIISWHFNGEGKDARFSALYSEAARAIRSHDSGRPVMCVELGWRSPGTVGLIDADIAGQGNYTGWYEGTLEHIGPYMDTYRALVRERYGRNLPILVSNYGAASDPEVHRERPRRNDFSHQYHTAFHRRFESEIARRPWMSGGLIFAWRDSVSGQPIPRHTWKGVLDMQDRKKDAYFYYQSIWTKEPMVHIVEKSWTARDLWPAGRGMQVEVFSNCDVVELFQGDKTLGRRKRGEPFTWEVRFAEGENLLRAVGEASKKVEDTVSIRVRFAPPAVEPRLTASSKNTLRLEWEPVTGVGQYGVYGASRPDFEPSSATLLGTTVQPWFETKPQSYGAYYRVVALAGAGGAPSPVVGWGPGAMQWRFANSGWLLSSPAVVDLDGDRRLEIVIGSYNGSVYALSREGRELWRFDTGGTVLASPVIASLRKGERPAVVFNSDGALYVLGHDGRLRWKHDGIRHFDRSVKSPSLGDLDGDGNLEIVVSSDTGEVLALDSTGRLLWRHTTAGPRTSGLSLTTPLVISDGTRAAGIALGADDGSLQFLSPQGKLRWKRDLGLGDTTPGLVPNILTPAAGPLQDGGPVRIVSGAGGLRVFDLDGNVVWERKEIRGAPQISTISADGTRRIVVSMAAVLWAVDGHGRDLWKFTLENRRDFFSQAPASADLDGDGRSDLIVGARSTHLYAISSEGKQLWRFKTDDELSGSPAVADLQGDGYADVILGSRDGFLYVIGAGAADALSLQYRGDPGRTGEYGRRANP